MLRTVGIADAARRIGDYPHQFSGGMRQRIMIAMALLTEPELLIADEPTTALDVTIEAQIVRLLEKLRAEFGVSIVFISHILGLVSELCDDVVVMYAGTVAERRRRRSSSPRPRIPIRGRCSPARRARATTATRGSPRSRARCPISSRCRPAASSSTAARERMPVCRERDARRFGPAAPGHRAACIHVGAP